MRKIKRTNPVDWYTCSEGAKYEFKMELNEPRAKKFCRLSTNLPLPVIFNKDNSLRIIKGLFNGYSVIVEDKNDMKNIISMGYFGKANFSRSYPQFADGNKTEILRLRQYNRRKEWSEKNKSKETNKVIVVPDSDEETSNDYFTNLKPEYRLDQSGIKETVWLGLDEAFFLSFVVTCLNIYADDRILTASEAWNIFSECNPHFKYDYAVYFYFRAKNWVVKPGIKFGGDYLLYKQGPPFYHASYVVIINILNKNLERIESLSRRNMDNVFLLGLNRLCETAGKELLIAQVILDENNTVHYEQLENITVKEILLRRWISTQENT